VYVHVQTEKFELFCYIICMNVCTRALCGPLIGE
jgi:hypothetical protein